MPTCQLWEPHAVAVIETHADSCLPLLRRLLLLSLDCSLSTSRRSCNKQLTRYSD